MSNITVLIADSQTADIDKLIAILSSDPDIEVAGVAATGRQAIDFVLNLKPSIVIISDTLKGLDSLEVIKQIMAYTPTPILVLNHPDSENKAEIVFKAISMGALDVMEKPFSSGSASKYGVASASELVETVRLLSRIKVVTHLAGKMENNRLFTRCREEPEITREKPIRMIAIAASTGGPSALAEILRKLPADLGIGVVIVQHVAEGFSAGLAEWLDKESKLIVREARNGDRIGFGSAFIAPSGSHMLVANGDRIVLNNAAPVSGHRPSADVLFASVAKTYESDSIGVILTGMGSDGAQGITAIKKAGGRTIAQDEESCVVFGMPQAAIQKGMVDEVLPLDSIAERIVRICRTSYTQKSEESHERG